MRSLPAWVMAVLLALSTGPASPAGAGIVQITDLPTGRFVSAPSISGDGKYITVGSNGNLGGVNPTLGGNVFVFELPTGVWTLITPDGGSDPTISADGRWVAFTSGADYVGRNVDGSDEIFRYDRLRRRFSQLTRDRNGDGGSELPVISGNGKRVVFETTSNLRRRNADFSNEVYLFNRAGNVPLSIDPESDGESHFPAISADGTLVAFETNSNLTGRNEDFSLELMVYDVKNRDLSQVTNDPEGNGDSSTAAVSGDGHFVVFLSSSNIDGLNPDGATAVFLMNRARHFSVITNSQDGVWDGDTPTINDDGRWIAFVAGFDITGGNPDHNGEILLYDHTRKTFAQITSSTGCPNFIPKITGDGTRIAFMSRCDYTGGNPDLGAEVFVADNPALNLVVHAEGPVGLEVRDPSDQVVNSTTTVIPRATYAQGDFDGDSQPEVRITIPQAVEGPYRVHIVPDSGAMPTDPVTVDLTLNAVPVTLADDSVGNLTGQELTFYNQTFSRRASRMTPVNGLGSSVTLQARLIHPLAPAGPVVLRFTDGFDEVRFDLGSIQGYSQILGRVFKGVVNGFTVKMRFINRTDGSVSATFSARDGDLSMFAGSSDVSMTIVLQVGPDTDMYQWRFKRRVNGRLLLR
jgi:Tol biopolymer transport system component